MLRYSINRGQRIVALVSTGEQTLAEWEAQLTGMIAKCPEVLTFDSITDGRGTSMVMDAKHVRDLVALNRRMGVQDHPRRSVHITLRKVLFGVSRMYELMTESHSKVRRLTTGSIEQAAAFLDRPVEVIQAELDAVANTAGG
jgi:hypothetical protein